MISNISSPVLPFLACITTAYSVSGVMLNVYKTAVDSILVCFCSDMVTNKATGKYAMSKNLFRFIKKKAKRYAYESTKYNKVDRGEDGLVYEEVGDTMAEVDINDENLDHGAANDNELELDAQQGAVSSKPERKLVV